MCMEKRLFLIHISGQLIEEGTAWADRIYAKVLDQLR